MDTEIELLRRAYRAFNEKDIEGVLANFGRDVDWPNAWEGGRVVGHAAVREYWTRQFAEIDPQVEPVGFEALSDGRVRVQVRQRVRDRGRNVLADGLVAHVYSVRDGLVERMEVED